MASEKQIVANKENAKKGGVKTYAGKEAIRFNARKHGILGNFLTEYEENIRSKFVEQLYEELRPTSILEEFLVERISMEYIRLFRIGKAEKEYFMSIMEPDEYTVIKPFLSKEGYKPVLRPEHVNQLLKIYSRYETSTENKLYKAIHMLERVQRMKRGEVVQAPMVLDINGNGFVSQNNEN